MLSMKSHEESLSSEQCRRILAALDSGPKSVESLVKLTRLTPGSVAKHLQVLQAANLATLDAEGLATKTTLA